MIPYLKFFFFCSLLLPLSLQAASLKVVTSFVPVYSWTAAVAGDKAQVDPLLDGSVGPHEFELAPSHMRQLNRAQLVVAIGLELEPWLEVMQEKGVLHKNVKILFLGEALDPKLLLRAEKEEEEEHVHADEHEHHHGEYDPHIWVDPLLAKECVQLICDQLCELDPENASSFRANAKSYQDKLKTLDSDIRSALKAVQLKPFYTQHDAFSYFNKRYGLNCAGVLQKVPDSDVSPRHLSELLKKIRDEKVAAILVPSRSEDRLVARVAQEGGIKVGRLETLETLDEGGKLDTGAYERIMRANLKALLESLQ